MDPRTASRAAAAAIVLSAALPAFGQAPPATPTPAAVKESVVVSATRGSELETEIPGEVTVITGEELRQRNVTNLADAIQDVVGLDTGLGSDNGARQPNVGLWGLKEFDALLFMVDGVPVGGPFNPSLSQINIDDIDRIEIVKGPQGTLYGVSAFAGMVQVFTKSASAGTSVTLAGGSFSNGRLDASTAIPIGPAMLRVFGTFERSKGWQDRTDYKDDRGGFRLDMPLAGGGKLSFNYTMFRNTQFFGSPLPVDPPSGETIEGFQIDRNYEPVGARLDHRVYLGHRRSVPSPLARDVPGHRLRVHARRPELGPKLHQRSRRQHGDGSRNLPQAQGDGCLCRRPSGEPVRGRRAAPPRGRISRDLGPDHGCGARF